MKSMPKLKENREGESRKAFKFTALGAVLRVLELRRIEGGRACPAWFREDGELSMIED
jgi:hypothetical protein